MSPEGLYPAPSVEDAAWDDPSDEDVWSVHGALVGALGGADRLSDLQRVTIAAITSSMTGRAPSPDLPETDPAGLALTMRDRAEPWRRRILHVMLVGALLLDDIPPDVVSRIDEYAAALGVDDDMLEVTRTLSGGAKAAALVDFERSGYEGDWSDDDTSAALGVGGLDSAWEIVDDDAGLAARWRDLADRPAGSLGRGVSNFYAARGFSYPGEPGSAPPLLAQHDWVHVLAGFGSTVESEIEVFSFIGMANENPQAFSLQAMVLSLFQTGNLETGAGLFEADSGHFSGDGEAMAIRMGDAMRRGFLCGTRSGGNDLLAVDWFSLADLPLEEVRRRFHIVPKHDGAWEAGSVTAWERGGISPFQFQQGVDVAAAEGVSYESHGASPGPVMPVGVAE